jgi:hypothetical protein
MKKNTNAHSFLEALRTALVGATGCAIQEGANGSGWPCGTCTCEVLAQLLSDTAPEYTQRNDPVNRINEVWRAILQMRDFRD